MCNDYYAVAKNKRFLYSSPKKSIMESPENLEDIVSEKKTILPLSGFGIDRRNSLEKFIDTIGTYRYSIGMSVFLGTIGYELHQYINGELNAIGALLHGVVQFDWAPIEKLFETDYFGNKLALRYDAPKIFIARLFKEIFQVLGPSLISIGTLAALKDISNYFRYTFGKNEAEKIIMGKKTRRLFRREKTLSLGEWWNLHENLTMSVLSEVFRDYEDCLLYNKKAVAIDPTNFAAVGDNAILQAIHYISKRDNREEMLKSCYNFFKRVAAGGYVNPLLWSQTASKSLVKLAKDIEVRRGKDNLNSQEKLGHNLALAVINLVRYDYKESIEALDFALNFENMFTRKEIDISPFVREVDVDDRVLKVVDQEAYDQFLMDIEQNDNQLAIFGAIAFDTIAKVSTVYRSLALEKSKWAFGQVFTKTRKDKRSHIQPFSESKSLTYIFQNSGFIEDEVVFKESADRKALENEIVNTYEIAKIVTQYKLFDVPTPIGIHDYEIKGSNKHVYIMRRFKGQTLKERLEQFQKSKITKVELDKDLDNIVDYLSLVHSKMRIRGMQELNFKEKVWKNLSSQNVDPKLIDSIIQNYTPLLVTAQKAKRVFSKDAHASNWLIDDEGYIVSLDNELTNPMPVHVDMVKLLEIFPGIPETSKKELILKYCRNMWQHPPRFELGYYNELINLTFRSIGSSVSWAGDMGIRQDLTIKSIKAINKVGIRFKRFYRRYEQEYKFLANALGILKDYWSNLAVTKKDETL
jgi:hypothetical protein